MPTGPRTVLLADAVINLGLGALLLAFPKTLVDLLGVPDTNTRFYPSLLGAVLLGIGLSLIIEVYRKPAGLTGLGLGGAVAINICGAAALTELLIFGDLNLPIQGSIFLWVLVFVLTVISAVEVLAHRRQVSGLNLQE